jgi:antitoxin component YwqK of YwqJK toxin-antitoxin module
MNNLRNFLSTTWMVLALVAAAGCSHPVLDYRNAEVSDGLIYARGANEPFTGKVTHVPDSFMINGEGHDKFMKEIGGDRYAVARLLQVVLGSGSPASLCTISVRKGYVDGSATCYRPQTDSKVIEAHFDGGQLSGRLVYYNPEKPDQKLAEGSFDGGQPDGTQTIYGASTGERTAKVNWSHGLYDGGYASFDEANGKVVLRGTFAQGQREGTWEKYAKAGKSLVARERFRHGLLGGVQEFFDADTGKRTLLVDKWTDGKISGSKKLWDKNGVLTSDEIYADGTLIERKDVSVKPRVEEEPPKRPLVGALSAPESKGSVRDRATSADLDACVNEWTAAHRKVVGEDALITVDQLDEWREWCRQGKRATR